MLCGGGVWRRRPAILDGDPSRRSTVMRQGHRQPAYIRLTRRRSDAPARPSSSGTERDRRDLHPNAGCELTTGHSISGFRQRQFGQMLVTHPCSPSVAGVPLDGRADSSPGRSSSPEGIRDRDAEGGELERRVGHAPIAANA